MRITLREAGDCLVEHGPTWCVRVHFDMGIPKTTFYRWYDRFLASDAGLEDGSCRVWKSDPG